MTGDVPFCLNDLYLVLLIKLVNKGMIGISEDNVASTLMKRTDHFCKLNMIVLIKLFFGISLEIRVFRYGEIRRIQKYKIARLSIVFKNKYIITAENIRLTKCFGSKSQSINITYLRILILAERSIELSTPVYTVQAVETSFVQIDRSCSSFGFRKCLPVKRTNLIKHLACILIFLQALNNIINMMCDLEIHIYQLRVAVSYDSILRLQRKE